ncbi:MAG TPA: DNA ligase D [Longimicrobiaceae bacterium]|nr:DNA ligase D [Longimicrobiaceae bacterium]
MAVRAPRRSPAPAAPAPDVPGAKRGPLPAFVTPQLATLVDEVPVEDGWIHEIKLDGYRLVCRIDSGHVRLLTRRGNDWTPRFPLLAARLAALPVASAMLDGELVVLTADGKTSFQELQSVLGSGSEERLAYYAFDLTHADGLDLRGAPLLARKERLRALLASVEGGDGPLVRYSDHFEGHGDQFHRQACLWGLEGIVCKRADAPYQSRRTRDWLKVKCVQRQEFVVGGFTAPKGSRVAMGALLLGYHDADGSLKFAGRVGTGFDDKTLRLLHERLAAHPRDESPFADHKRDKHARWVEPRTVVEISFTEWTDEGILRHPVFEGVREDKRPTDVVREMPEPIGGPLAAPVRHGGKKIAERASGDARRPEVMDRSGDARAAAKRPVPRSASAPSLPSRRRREGDAEVSGVRISNPTRMLFSAAGVTKLELARYYEEIGRWMVPQITGRPLTLVRCPNGADGQCFYQKQPGEGFPESIRRVELEESGGEKTVNTYVDSVRGVVATVQFGVLELHTWGSRADRPDRPDRMIMDLDPAPDVSWARVVESAFELRERLRDFGLESFVKTTGGKGLHVVAPLARRNTWDEVKRFSKALAEDVAAASPGQYLTKSTLSKRAGKIFLDYLRNGRGATAVCAYSVRARPGATVSTPLRWEELSPELDPAAFTVRTVAQRLAKLREDPWNGYDDVRQSITKRMRERIGSA